MEATDKWVLRDILLWTHRLISIIYLSCNRIEKTYRLTKAHYPENARAGKSLQLKKPGQIRISFLDQIRLSVFASSWKTK